MDSSPNDFLSFGADIDGSDSTKREKARTKSEIDISCSVCNTDFSTSEHYQRHLGTKKHKRNERIIRKEMLNGENPQLPTAHTFDEKWSHLGVREKYWQRKIRNYEDNYTSYIWSVTAYWTAKLVINPAIKDFKISLNDTKWGDFGDVVIEIDLTDISGKRSATKTFAIQFKQIVSNKFRTIESLGEGSFSVVNTVSKLASIKCEEDLDTVKFVMFTTAAVSPALNIHSPVNIAFCSSCCQLKHRCACDVSHKADKDLKQITTEVPIYVKTFNYRSKNIIDTSDDTQSIYHFFSSDNKYVLPKIYFYTSQKRPKHFPASIDDVFCEELGGQRVQISRELTKYIENWCEGKCGGTYKLRKEDVLVKLGQLLLFKFAVTPKMHLMELQKQNTSFDVWLEAVNCAQVTVLKDSVNLSEFCVPMNLAIEKELEVQIDATQEGVQVLKSKCLDVNNALGDYLFEELPRNYGDGNVPIELVYLTFWKAALIPMILHVDSRKNQEYVLQVINSLTGCGLHRRYFLKTHNLNVDERSYKNLSFFVTLDDVIAKLHPSLLDRVKINVSDAYSMSLSGIRATDKLFQKRIYANEFFDMAMGKYSFKAHGSSLSKGRDCTEELKLVLSGDQMKHLKRGIESKIDFGYLLKQDDGVLKSRCLRGLDPKLFG